MNNRYGVDVAYFTKELAGLSRSLPHRTPEELVRYLVRLSEIAKPLKTAESPATVRSKRPVQQRKAKIKRSCVTCGDSSCENSARCWESGGKYWRPRSTSAVA